MYGAGWRVLRTAGAADAFAALAPFPLAAVAPVAAF